MRETTLSSSDAQTLLESGTARYLDVRSEQEFAQGHVPGATNAPLQLGTLAGLVDNPDFSVHLDRLDKQTHWVVGCRTSARAKRAIELMRQRGFVRLSLHADGWEGVRDAFGRVSGGWVRLGLPVETGPTEGLV